MAVIHTLIDLFNKMEKKSIKILDKKNLLPFVLVSSLFALWGFANNLTDPMVQAFKKVLELSNSEAAWIQMAFYGGYFSMAFPAALLMKKYSYKLGIIIGLSFYSIGALLFYPAAVTEKFWFFCLGLYILTFGLAFLETSANPYILSLGHKKTSTQRLNFAQSFNPIGSIAGLFIAQQFVLKNLKSDDIVDFSLLDESSKIIIKTSDLLIIRNPYVILGLVIILILILFIILKMPEIKGSNNDYSVKKIINSLVNKKNYTLGVLAQIFYVGVQIMCWTYIYQYAEAINVDSVEAGNYQMVALILFTFGRGISTYLFRFFKPPLLMLIFSIIAITLNLNTIFNQGIHGLYSLVLISFFMSLMFPTIYGIALKNLSENEAKIGSAGLVMAIVGGALMPKIQGIIIDIGGSGVSDTTLMGVSEINFSFILPLVCFLYISCYSYYIIKNPHL